MAEQGFVDWLKEKLDEEEGMSQRELARQTQRRAEWGSQTTLFFILEGKMAPTIKAMEAVAGVFQVKPSVWPDYRMAVLRRDLNPEKVGRAKALRTLRKIEN